MDIATAIHSLGGIAPTHRLLRMGWSGRMLSAAALDGSIVRVRQGWYSSPFEPPNHLAAWRVGGRLTCVSGANELGLWIRRASDTLHIAVTPTTSRLRTPTDMRSLLTAHCDVVIHWRPQQAGSAFIESPLTCLIDMCRCEPAEFVIAAADSAIHRGLIAPEMWQRAITALPAWLRLLLADVDGKSESIIESVTRVRCRRLGLIVRSQVNLAPGVRVDLLIGERLVVEVDGSEFHSDPSAFERDRARDALLSALGYRVLHFSYNQVMFDWPTVENAILAAVARGHHRERVQFAKR